MSKGYFSEMYKLESSMTFVLALCLSGASTYLVPFCGNSGNSDSTPAVQFKWSLQSDTAAHGDAVISVSIHKLHINRFPKLSQLFLYFVH